MKNVFYKFVIVTVLLSGCAKSAPESITEAALHQADAIEAKINKECPRAEISVEMMSLRSIIRGQLASCEDSLQIYRERNNTLWLAIFAMVALWLFANWAKIKSKVFK